MSEHKKIPVIPCGIALIENAGHILISQRKANDTFGSFWEFPGGKKNTNETFEQCVVRETREETGVEVAVRNKFMEIRKFYNDRLIFLNFFLCDYVSGDPKPLDCQKVLWTPVTELIRYGFPPANEIVIQKLIEDFSRA